ncbi:uncharacterized protein F4807DRAFT_87739 [Annulohypoxylon truncatum]|uniref:uncharacterized protein n=1 Tax=Annulohypoxylon truncatum TaxID=327061 RepID=UPI00200895D8|nr:uncharacterized protein F4807DRAFT_87739 [Annulohypoxylon truncatum]KAI1209722.1 hypothetical protein F4807DRAFT_87739 [Annulohypoxylon truncatum]
MALPLFLHYDEDRSILLSDSDDDDDLLPTPRKPMRSDSMERDEAMRQKTKDAAANVPTHPIPAMQPAFAESLIEATDVPAVAKPKLRFADARERRNYLLDGEKGSKLYGELWRYRAGQRYHELWKLMAQISFGVYLLLNGIANSNEQVVGILQSHIDEVDEFLETTLEDVELAIQDIRERIDLLKLPMENIQTFEQMLEDRNFRLQIVTGNEKIEHIISRTTTSLEAIAGDVNEGIGATKQFATYLGEQQGRAWRQQRPDVVEIFDAMRGNAQGWYKTFLQLQGTTSTLRGLLNKLDQMVIEMNYRAGEVSRRTRQASVAPFSSPVEPPPKSSARTFSNLSSDRRPPKLELSKTASQKSATGSTATRSTVMVVQYSAPLEPMSPVELEADSVPNPIVTIEEEPKPENEADKESPVDEGLFILQPRTYTPQPPAPIPSPRVQDPPTQKQEEQPVKRTSLRQRLSSKGSNLPEAIQVPPRNAPELQRPRYPPIQNQSHYQGSDSAYGSDNETRQPVRARTEYGDIAEVPPLPNFTTTIPSPRSDQQHYFPVRASPHSPLQQRPWTSGTNVHQNHVRNQPSAMGMSMLSNVTTLSPENKTLKKKRSAFGWLKKAFSLDDEERAEFEARRAQKSPNPYYDSRSPRYLDGKRLPDYGRR